MHLMLGWSAAPEIIERLKQRERTRRPLGADPFVTKLEKRLGRTLRPRKPGRKPNQRSDRKRGK